MTPADLARLVRLPEPRTCVCGGAIGWSHTAYAGHGESVGVYTCRHCGLAYRGPLRARRDPGRGRRHLPAAAEAPGGPPENPVLDAATAERLRALLQDG